jgi:Arylsulfotransferase (ASST)
VRRLRVAGAGTLAVALLALGLAACVPVKSPGPPLVITTDPALFPAFQSGVIDYVNRCDPSTPTAVNVNAPADTTVSVNGSPPATGTFTVQVPQEVGERFTVDITTGGNTTTHHVRCLPTDFPSWTVEKPGVPQAEFYATALVQGFGAPSYSAIFDTNGVPVWWLDRKPTFLLQPLPNQNLAILNIGAGMEEYDLNGNLVRSLTTVGGDTDFHEVILLPNGNYVMATVQEQPCNLTSWGLGVLETCLNHVFQELTPLGVPVWQWDTALHIPVTETTPEWQAEQTSQVRDAYDPWHYNSIESIGDGYILSFRHLDAIYKVENTVAGNIVWKLGGTAHPESLQLVDDPFNGISGQHDARLLPDGSVTLYDNGTLGLGPPRPPRNVRYALNLQANTATLIEQIADGEVVRSGCCGSTRRLAGGNYVTGWGGNFQISEYSPNGARVFRINGSFVYRGTPTPPGQYTAQQFRDGMDAQFAS